jgi:hypothetical protein
MRVLTLANLSEGGLDSSASLAPNQSSESTESQEANDEPEDSADETDQPEQPPEEQEHSDIEIDDDGDDDIYVDAQDNAGRSSGGSEFFDAREYAEDADHVDEQTRTDRDLAEQLQRDEDESSYYLATGNLSRDSAVSDVSMVLDDD